MSGSAAELKYDGATRGGVLRRLLKARAAAQQDAGRAEPLPEPLPPTPAKAGATAVGRAADRLYNLAVQASDVMTVGLSLAEMPELLPDGALIGVLQGPDDLTGVMALSPEMVTALIEVQALGRVTSRVAERRRPTRSDAMLCADFMNAVLAELAEDVPVIEGYEGWRGYRYASYLDDPRPLMLMLDDRPYRSMTLELRMGGTDGRNGSIFIALPQPGLPERGRPALEPTPLETNLGKPIEPAPAKKDRPSLAAAALDAPVEVVAVLCRRRITLGELRNLTPGKVLPLPKVSLADTQIETRSGQVLAKGKLGEVDGCHAIRLRGPEEGEIHQPTDLSRHQPTIGDLNRPDPFRAPEPASDEPAPAAIAVAGGTSAHGGITS